MDRPGHSDTLHPLPSIQWRKACKLPVEIRDAQSVVMGQNVVIGGGWASGDTITNATVYVYDINRDNWAIHSIAPTYWSALTTYHSQLLLAGGKEVDSGSVTNFVYVFKNGQWRRSRPSMMLSCYGASAVSRERHLIVAGGIDLHDKATNTVNVFDGKSWTIAKSLPKKCRYMKSVLNNDAWYVCGGVGQGCEIYSASLQSIVDSTPGSQSKVWTKLPPTPHQYSSVAVVSQQLLAIGGGKPLTPAVHAFSPLSQSWLHVGDLPVPLGYTCSLTLPNGELMTLGGNYCDKVFIGQLKTLKSCGVSELTMEQNQSPPAKVEQESAEPKTDEGAVQHSETGVHSSMEYESGGVRRVEEEVKSKPVPSSLSVGEVGQMHIIMTEPTEEEEPLSEVMLLRRQNTEWREKCQKLEAENMELKRRLEEWREGEGGNCKETECAQEEPGEGGSEKGKDRHSSPEKTAATSRLARRKRPASHHGAVEGMSNKRLRDNERANDEQSQANALDIEDLFDVNAALIPVAGRWKQLGLALRLNPTVLETIRKDEDNVGDCLCTMLTQWLKKAYNVQRFGEPSWQLLVKAVRHRAGGDDYALADTIARKYGV